VKKTHIVAECCVVLLERADPMSSPKLHLVTATSIVFWLWGVVLILSGIAIGYPALAKSGTGGPLAVLVTWGLAYCICGIALRRRQWGVRWWAGGLCIISIVVLFNLSLRISLVGIVLNMLALALIAGSWRALDNDAGP
jgi:hypothetical protein